MWFLWDLSFKRKLLKELRKIMVTQAELDAKLDELSASVSTEMQQLVDAINAQAPDLAPQAAKVQALIDALASDDPQAPQT